MGQRRSERARFLAYNALFLLSESVITGACAGVDAILSVHPQFMGRLKEIQAFDNLPLDYGS